jgi:hypothetical protein
MPAPSFAEIVPLPDGPPPRVNATWTAVPAAHALVLLGGEDPRTGALLGDCWLFDTLHERWTRLPFEVSRAGHTAVLVADGVLVFGGRGPDGVLAAPQWLDTRTWQLSALTAAEAPAPRVGHAAVALGTGVLVWGGLDADQRPLDDGAIYDPSLARWQPLATADAPLARSDATLVWTGREAILWGGANETRMPSEMGSAAFDPHLARWHTLSDDDAPAPVAGPSAVWTGQELFVASREGWFAFDPARDRWRLLSEQVTRGAALTVRDGSVLAVGGGRGTQAVGEVVRVDTSGHVAVLARDVPALAREDALSASVGDALFVLFGRTGGNLVLGGARFTLR